MTFANGAEITANNFTDCFFATPCTYPIYMGEFCISHELWQIYFWHFTAKSICYSASRKTTKRNFQQKIYKC